MEIAIKNIESDHKKHDSFDVIKEFIYNQKNVQIRTIRQLIILNRQDYLADN